MTENTTKDSHNSDALGLEFDEAKHRKLLALFGEFALQQAAAAMTMPSRGVVGEDGANLANAHSREISEAPHPEGAEGILAILGALVDAAFTTPAPGYLAYVPGGGLFAAALADLVSNVCNRYTGIAAAAPGFCRLEADVLRWLATEFGFGPEARGLFTSGGSLANFSAIVTARHRHFGDSGNYVRACAYTSSQAHHSVAKAMRLAGIPARNLRSIGVDNHFKMDMDALQRAVHDDRQAGKQPFLVVAAAGTTNTGAIDPLPELADFCAHERLWLHIDGAYGGAFVLCPEGRTRLKAIERADSITFDPHKGLFLPYGTGCLLVRQGEHLRRAHQLDADYLQDLETSDTERVPSPADYGPELSRDFRGLRLWLPLMLHGVAPFRAALQEKLELAEYFHRALLTRIGQGAPLEIVAAPQLSAVAFRLRRNPGEKNAAYNARNARLQDEINSRDRVFLSSTSLDGTDGPLFTLRICILSFRTHIDHIDACLSDLDAAMGFAQEPLM